jgi:hypothetical protein
MPVQLQITKSGVAQTLLEAGALLKPPSAAPASARGDVPFNGGLSILATQPGLQEPRRLEAQ